jgi:hypothetical protein
MAQGMRQGMSRRPPKGMGKAEGKEGAACTAGKALLPMLSDIVNPKMARLCRGTAGGAQSNDSGEQPKLGKGGSVPGCRWWPSGS